MKASDSVEFEAVDLATMQRAHEAQTPVRAAFPGGIVFEELRAGTGAFRKYDPARGVTMEHSAHIEYASTLGEQFLQMRGAA